MKQFVTVVRVALTAALGLAAPCVADPIGYVSGAQQLRATTHLGNSFGPPVTGGYDLTAPLGSFAPPVQNLADSRVVPGLSAPNNRVIVGVGGSYASTFGDSGFSVAMLANSNSTCPLGPGPNPTTGVGEADSRSFGSLTVTFQITEPTIVRFTGSVETTASSNANPPGAPSGLQWISSAASSLRLIRNGGPVVFAIANNGLVGNVTTTLNIPDTLLEAGAYTFTADISAISVVQEAAYGTRTAEARAQFGLSAVPAPGGAAAMLGIGALAAMRRRRA